MVSLSRRGLRSTLLAVILPIVAGGVALSAKKSHAEDATADKAESNERCAIRLAIALQGKSADPAQLTAADPQADVDTMLASPEFADRYASFLNSKLNGGPIDDPNDDPIYALTNYVITQKLPWSDLYIGPYDLTPKAAANTGMDVKNDPDGVGYFHSLSWKKRYAGNESAGIMLVAAFRMVQNTTGLELTPSIGQPGDDRTINGRSTGVCKTCHFDPWFAIDTVATLLPTRVGQGDTMTFKAPSGKPAQLLGKSIPDDKTLLVSLVNSDPWLFTQCRNVFDFLYGRDENQCEAKVFDACVDALQSQKTLQSAVAAVAKDPSFCTN